jgi:predicted nucleotidyltransferase
VASSGPTDAVSAALRADPRVRSVSLVGSRADGTATTLSDWDYHVSSSDPAAVSLRLPDLTRPLRPLSQLWDPLARHPGYMLIVAPHRTLRGQGRFTT